MMINRLEQEGLPVTASGLAKQFQWPLYYCTSALRLLGRARRRGRQPVDYGKIKVEVAQVLAHSLIEQRELNKEELIKAVGASRWAVVKVLRQLGLKLVEAG